MHEETALFLYKMTKDPMLLDGIRVLNDPKTTQKMTKAVQKYVEYKFVAYLNLYENGAIDLPYGLRPEQFDPADQPE